MESVEMNYNSIIVSIICKNDPHRPMYSIEEKRIRYSNTSIYKIQCKDPTISKVYIGHTINFEGRKDDHIFVDHKQHSPKLYDYIQLNGGWDNWEISILGTYTCNNRGHASRIEWYWWRKYSDVKTIWDKDTKTLNTIRPGINYVKRDMKKYHDHIDEYISNLELISRKITIVKHNENNETH